MTGLRRFTFFFCMAIALTCHVAFGQFPDEECECLSGDCQEKKIKREGKIAEPKDLGDKFKTSSQGGAVTVTPTKTVIDFKKINKDGKEKNLQDILKDIIGDSEGEKSSGKDSKQ